VKPVTRSFAPVVPHAFRRGVFFCGESKIDFRQVCGYIEGAGTELSLHNVTL
jgi:hypothetical protein